MGNTTNKKDGSKTFYAAGRLLGKSSKNEDKTLDDLTKLTTEEKKLLQTLRGQNLSAEEMKSIANGFKYPGRSQLKRYDHSKGGTKFRFALMGDTHMGNRSFNLEALTDFYNTAYADGIREFYHTGDIVDGLHVHRGQEYEQYALGLEKQAEDVIKNYPSLKDATTYFILGNHDMWYKQNAGANIGNRIVEKRKDLVCLGEREADIIIGNDSILRLMHPDGGCSYAISHKPQKITEALAGGNKPNILAIGHYHKMFFLEYRNVFVYLTGCFEEQTEFMRGRNLMAVVGGWIVEGESGENGGIKRIKSEFIPYMKGK